MSAAQCTLTQHGAVTTVPVRPKVTLHYIFDTTATKTDLRLPYAVAINGRVPEQYVDKAKALNSSHVIEVKVDKGDTVALYLNSDAHPSWRTNPVYKVSVGANDVLVEIKERKGRLPHVKAEVGSATCAKTATGNVTEKYVTELTGDIWMSISHLYSCEEADALLPSNTLPAVRNAIKKIFGGLKNARLEVDFEATNARPALAMLLIFSGSDDVKENTTYCPLLTGEIPRTHPLAYAALITEAYFAGITNITVTSGWRPTFGSIAHRAGLGLDINYVTSPSANVRVNRATLIGSTSPVDANVSATERALYTQLCAAMAGKQAAEKAAHAAKRHVGRQRDEAIARLKKAQEDLSEAQDRWEQEVRLNEPELIRDFRDRLAKNSNVAQMLDPWYMDYNTGDEVPGKINRQIDKAEKAHNNHLHITISEPKLL